MAGLCPAHNRPADGFDGAASFTDIGKQSGPPVRTQRWKRLHVHRLRVRAIGCEFLERILKLALLLPVLPAQPHLPMANGEWISYLPGFRIFGWVVPFERHHWRRGE